MRQLSILLIFRLIFTYFHISKITAENGEVQVLDFKRMQSAVMDSTDSWLVIYYDPSVDKVNDLISSVSDKISTYGISVGTVDCKQEIKLCKSGGLVNMPSIRLYIEKPNRNPYSKKMFRTSVDFTGGTLDRKSMERFIAKAFPSSLVQKVDLIEQLESFVLSNSNLSTVLLFSAKSTIPIMFRTIAYSLKGRMNFMSIGIQSPNEISVRYNISSTTIAILEPGLSDKLTQYSDGEMKSRSAIVSWLLPFALQDPTNNQPSTDASDLGVNAPFQDNHDRFLSGQFQLNKISTDSAWMIVVVEEGSDLPPLWLNATKGCVGHIKPAVLVCSKADLHISDIDVTGDISAKQNVLTFGQQACSQRVTNLPFLLMIRYGSIDRKKPEILPKWSNVIMELTAHEKALKVLGDSLPSSAVIGLFENYIPQFVSEGAQKGLLSFILLSNSAEPPALFKNIALSYAGIAQFGFMTGADPDFVKGTGNTKLPALIAIPPPSDEESDKGLRVINYDHKAFGPMRFASLSQFVNAIYRNTGFIKKDDDSSAEVDSLSGSAEALALFTIDSEENWEQQCGESFRGICAIGLLSLSSGSEILQGIESIQAAISSVGKRGSAFRFLAIDAGCQRDFAESFGIHSHELPTIVMYSPSKRRSQVMKGSFSEVSIKEFMLSIFSGNFFTDAMSVRPVVASSCVNYASDGEGQGEALEESTESIEDAEEFLREIRREEDTRAAQIKLEIKEEQLRLAEEATKAAKKKTNKKKKKKVKAKKMEL